ncbi:hypothetical protein Sjap_012762 [Stephania japonica]|uniref:VQ domain-containing protein n=1 Tax=Stephania japonica TaxID=461633 RepID=A0AAP0NZ89_9MAGN
MTKVPLLMCNTTTNNNERSSRREENQIKGSLMVKPKIRIVHIFAPKAIETDPANFRQLVQRLTGKPAARKGRSSGSKRRNDHKMMVMRRGANEGLVPLEVQLMEEASLSLTSSQSSWDRYRCDPMIGMKEEEGMWRGGLEDFDGFVQGLVEFPFMPLLNNTSCDHHMDVLI